jgi:hypothetical protein
MTGFEDGLNAARRLAALVMQTLEQTVGLFVHLHLKDLSEHEVIRLPVRESIHEARFDYFMKAERDNQGSM